jgi:hypothetical protein
MEPFRSGTPATSQGDHSDFVTTQITLDAMRIELQNLRQQVESQQSTISQQQFQLDQQGIPPRTAIRISPPPSDGPKRKPLPIGPPFDGNRNTFAAWRVTISHKLVTDQGFIGDRRDQFVFIWQNLTPQVQSKVAAFYEVASMVETPEPSRFLDYLESMYGDPHRQDIAQAKLDTLQQQSQESFASFYVRFEQNLALAGGMEWTDIIKLSILRKALSPRIREIGLNRGVSRNDFHTAVAMYRSIAVDIEAFRIEERSRSRSTPHRNPRSAQTRDRDGDIAMTGINATQTQPRNQVQRARWVTEGEMRKRREQGLCLRCGQSGHFVTKCYMAPARRPLGTNKVETIEDSERSQSDPEEASGN